MKNISLIIRNHKQEFILGILICIYIFYFTTASFLRYDNFYTGRFDLGNMDQTVWSTRHGRIFEITDPNGTENISRLAFHADFLLILLAPFYFIWPSPKMLLLIQSVVLSLGALFIYLIAKNVLRNKGLSLVFSFAFLMNPALQFTNLYDFHPVTLATATLLAAFYFVQKQKYLLTAFFLLLSGLAKEQVWIITSLFGIFIFLRKETRAKLLGAGIFLSSLLTFYYLVWHAIPNTLGEQHFALSYYSDFGGSPSEVLKNILFSPQRTFGLIFQPDRLYYLYQLFLPLGFLSLFSPFFIIFSLPDLTINLLSSNASLRQIYYQYSAAVTPFLFISGIFGFRKVCKWLPKLDPSYLAIYLTAAVFFSSYIFGPLPFSKKPNITMFVNPQKDKAAINSYLSSIPQKLSVSSTNNLGSHLSHRQKIYTVPLGMDRADLVMFLFDDSPFKPALSEQKQMAETVRKNKNYQEVFRKGNFLVFQKIKS